MAKNTIIIIISALLITSFLVYFFFFRNLPFEKVKIKLKDQNYQVEIASTTQQKSKGLSNREKLCSKCGMLFVFNKDKSLPFWMKDTLIPLDIIWINSENKIVDIQSANPQLNTPTSRLTIYRNQDLAKYVLELNAGDSQKLNLKIGDIIEIPNLDE